MRTPSQVRTGRARFFLSCVLALAGLGLSKNAHAEKVLVKADDGSWEVYTDGRVGAFLSYSYGDGLPRPTFQVGADGVAVPTRSISGGGFPVTNEQKQIIDADHPASQDLPGQGTVNAMRVRTGFIGNVLGFGVRGQLTPTIKFTGYLQLWAFIESEGREKNRPNYVDARQGYAKIESWWGSVVRGHFFRAEQRISMLNTHTVGGSVFPAVSTRAAPRTDKSALACSVAVLLVA